MIDFRKGDIVTTDTEALVNTVNCVGFMGRGIALQFKKAFPENFREYATACRRGEVEPGRMLVHITGQTTNPHYIINFPTKRHWKGKSRLSDIETGLDDLVLTITKFGIRSIAIPPLGCGLGGLDWRDVRPLVESALSRIPQVEAVVFEPAGAPLASKMARTSSVPKMTPGRATLIVLMQRYLLALMDPFVTLLEIHKLMYFLQEAGEPLKLNFVKAPLGPFAENLRHVLNDMEGYQISGYADGGDNPAKQISLVPGAVKDAERFLEDHAETLSRFSRVTDLVQGFETPFGLELLATVHWTAIHGTMPESFDDLLEQTYAWSEHKKQFTPRQVRLAWDILKEKGWIGGKG